MLLRPLADLVKELQASDKRGTPSRALLLPSEVAKRRLQQRLPTGNPVRRRRGRILFQDRSRTRVEQSGGVFRSGWVGSGGARRDRREDNHSEGEQRSAERRNPNTFRDERTHVKSDKSYAATKKSLQRDT